MTSNPLRVCYFGTYRANYVRNRLLIDRLRARGVQVIECHATLWHGLEDRQQVASGGWFNPAFWWRVISAYARLVGRYFQVGPYDVMLIGYPGQPDVLLGRCLSWLRRKPLAWDVLMSIYLITLERKLEQLSPLSARLIRLVESLACRLPDLLIIDTAEYAHWFQENYHIPAAKIRLLPLGADDRLFHPLTVPRRAHGKFLCLYYGTYIPNHGVPYILEAARLLREQADIQFEFIGQGPEREKILALVQENQLHNVTFIDWMEVETLVQHIAAADVILGTFGITPQALMTMQNKIHEGLAMARPVINGDSPVMRSTLRHGENIYLCERENGPALAQAILALHDDPALRHLLADQGYAFYREHLSMERIGDRLVQYLQELVNG